MFRHFHSLFHIFASYHLILNECFCFLLFWNWIVNSSLLQSTANLNNVFYSFSCHHTSTSTFSPLMLDKNRFSNCSLGRFEALWSLIPIRLVYTTYQMDEKRGEKNEKKKETKLYVDIEWMRLEIKIKIGNSCSLLILISLQTFRTALLKIHSNMNQQKNFLMKKFNFVTHSNLISSHLEVLFSSLISFLFHFSLCIKQNSILFVWNNVVVVVVVDEELDGVEWDLRWKRLRLKTLTLTCICHSSNELKEKEKSRWILDVNSVWEITQVSKVFANPLIRI